MKRNSLRTNVCVLPERIQKYGFAFHGTQVLNWEWAEYANAEKKKIK
jgi:hypothetical protein